MKSIINTAGNTKSGILGKENDFKDTSPLLKLLQESFHQISSVQNLESRVKVELLIGKTFEEKRVTVNDKDFTTNKIPNEVYDS
ncbi:hypothetical protein N7513_003031 [Penicillium frequentans]|nr:hypothetical protein N7513_003031 [Penicillium glabrum]